MKNSEKYVKLKNGMQTPRIGLGTYGLRGRSGINTIRKALDLGYQHIDTARMYGNEEEVGHAIKNFKREDVFVTSKVQAHNLYYEEVLETAEKSLKLLSTDYIDLYLIHWPNKKIPLEKTLAAFEKLIEEDKIKSFGASNFNKNDLKNALELESEYNLSIVNNQIEFNPFEYPKDTVIFSQKYDIKVTAYSPLAQGAVFKNEKLSEIAEKYGKSSGQIALRWLLQKDAIVIPKASTEAHLQENIDIFNFEISEEDMDKIESF